MAEIAARAWLSMTLPPVGAVGVAGTSQLPPAYTRYVAEEMSYARIPSRGRRKRQPPALSWYACYGCSHLSC